MLKTVLIVDDNAVNLQILEEMLAGDYRLLFARNGREAISLAADFQPSIILLDVMMPGWDGLEVCRRLRHLSGVSDAAIIMVSAKAMPSEQADGFDAGADEYITKPFDEAELTALLRRYASPKGADVLFSDEKGLAAY